MQASQASNETRLPRAVLRRSAAIQAKLDAQKAESEALPADPNAPPAPPSAEAAPPEVPGPQTPPAAPADPRENDPAYWKQRFNVTAGVLRREREERAEEIGGLNQRVAELQDQIRNLQAAAPAADTLDVSQVLTPEQVEILGEEESKVVVTAVLAKAREEARKLVEAEVKPLRDQRASEQAQAVKNRKAKFQEDLAALVPDFAEIDSDPSWLEWLAQDDETTGVTRQSILDQHVGRLDVAKVAKLFTAFKAVSAGPVPPAPPVAPQGTGATPPGGVPPAPDTSMRAPTPAEVKDFYKRAALGRVKDEERVKFEARLKLPRR